MLKIENLCKYYGKTVALSDANLEVKAGEHVVLIGASGSGKSTLLRCINYLETPDSGSVWLDGQYIGGQFSPNGQWIPDSAQQLARKRQQIGMVFQGFHLFSHLSALDNVAIGPHKVLGKPKSVCRELGRYLLDKVHLGHRVNQYPWQLSGGEQQRVAIARALAMNPKLMLFDEPTSALDPRLTHEVLQVMQELADEGMTMLIVTHEMRFAQKVAHRVIFLEHGRIVEAGSTEAIFNRPQREETRRFLSYVL
ncbi:amino acid ABC transporter ATP-binding protein [Oscillatoria sp. FACHB-1407]|nr:amino acid ABC transporter ATP-binding protein [Oscillatoria sp. FACHB-1407]